MQSFAQLACLWEATARKAGNVHPGQSFHDLTYLDFVHSAVAVGPVLERAPKQSVGMTLLEAVRATRAVVHTNTNLGILLLLTPLAKSATPDSSGVARVLANLTVEDSKHAYQAIRIAGAGGMAKVEDQDLGDEPTLPLREVMRLAENRDRIAWQYTHDFADVFDIGVPAVQEGLRRCPCFEEVIQWTQLTLLQHLPDSLISRKRGREDAEEASRKAAGVLSAGWPHSETGWKAFADLDGWLRAEGHARNPGTTADLVTASLFIALRQAIIALPLPLPWSHG